MRRRAAAQARRGVSKTLECEPRRWKVIERVREKFACRDCEAITEPPAPSHPIPRGFAGPSLLAMILVGKFGDHLPLNRQSAAFAREGIELDDFDARRLGRRMRRCARSRARRASPPRARRRALACRRQCAAEARRKDGRDGLKVWVLKLR